MGFLTKIASILKRSNKEGQHTIEYAVLMILVMAGIITMGRYVIRSWNANIKGYEDSASDSMEDPLLPTGPPSIPPGCSSAGFVPTGCGLGITNLCLGTTPSCADTEMTSLKIFSPSGCQCASCSADDCILRCTPDPCCCSTPVALGCGIAPGGTTLPACSSTGLSSTLPGGGCPFGNMGYSTTCGGSTFFGCLSDLFCVISCPASVLSTGPAVSDLFPQTNEGQVGTSFCRPTFSGGPPERDCLAGGVWGPLRNPCVLACPDGNCDGTIGENCNNCPADCGLPLPYGGCPPTCKPDGECFSCTGNMSTAFCPTTFCDSTLPCCSGATSVDTFDVGMPTCVNWLICGAGFDNCDSACAGCP